LSRERLQVLPDGRVRWSLKRPWSDGTTALMFSPEAFVERLVALIPPARANTIVYHGIFASQAKGRGQFLPRPSPRRRPKVLRLSRPNVRNESSRWTPWAELLLRVFSVDRVACPHCGEAMSLRTVVVRPPATTRVLRGLCLSARGPP
jgi:hypothetical protein